MAKSRHAEGLSDASFYWTSPKVCAVLLAFAGLLYVFSIPRYYVGWFGDDASYIEGARSLLQGRYVALHDPHAAVQTQFPPGYPLFLVPFVKLAAGHWALLKLPSIALTLLSIVLAWKLFKGWTTPAVAWAGTFLLAFNPITVKYSATIQSEPLYLFLTLLAFYLFRLSLKPSSPAWLPWALGAALGWAAIVRTIGILLIPSVAAGFIYARRWREGSRSILLAVLAPLGLYLYNHAHTGRTTLHMDLLRNTLGLMQAEGAGAWLDHLHRTAYFFFINGLGGAALPYARWSVVLSIFLFILLAGLTVIGARSLLSGRTALKPWIVGMVVYSIGYLSVHCLWISLSSRFVFPLLPFLAIFAAEGIRRVSLLFSRPRWIALSLAGLLGISHVYHNALFFKELSHQKNAPPVLPKTTFEWMGKHLPSQALLLCPNAPTLHLFTGLHGVVGIPAEDIEGFRYQLLQKGVTHALLQPRPQIIVRNVTYPQVQNRLWIQGWTEVFPIIYKNSSEETTIHAISSDPAFQKAYELYARAVMDLQTSSFPEAMALLDQALKQYPSLASAHQAYGTAFFMLNKPERAEASFKKALLIRPYFPLALLNLARLYQKTGRFQLALQTYDQALSAISLSAESPELEGLIYKEKTALKNTWKDS
jgi:hypothetical protein